MKWYYVVGIALGALALGYGGRYLMERNKANGEAPAGGDTPAAGADTAPVTE